MNKENNCPCVVCNVEAALLDSFSTQITRTQFQALASIYPVFNHFSSPIDVVEYLHQQGEAANPNAGSEILHALIHAIGATPFEEFGQQLLLLALTPAIHKVCSEISQRFLSLPLEDIAQQAWLCLLEAAKSTVIARQNGHLLLALLRMFRKNIFRWAIKEARITAAEDENASEHEQASEDNFERDYELDAFLGYCRARGALSEVDYELLLKFECQGFEAAELRGSRWRSAKAVHHRLEKILNRLRRIAADSDSPRPKATIASESPIWPKPKKNQSRGGISRGECPFSNSEKGFSPKLSHPIPQAGTDVTQIAV